MPPEEQLICSQDFNFESETVLNFMTDIGATKAQRKLSERLPLDAEALADSIQPLVELDNRTSFLVQIIDPQNENAVDTTRYQFWSLHLTNALPN